jgi:chaperonin GroEL
VAANVEAGKEVNYGYNALTGEYGDMVKMGVIVPTKVERIALQNAASIAGLLLTTDAVITEIKEKKKDAGHSHGGMDDMDY